MSRLCDIVKAGVPCQVRYKDYSTIYDWDGDYLLGGTCRQVASHGVVCSDAWSLVVPETPESVGKKRGYDLQDEKDRWWIVGKDMVAKLLDCPPTIERVNRIIDALEGV